MSKLLQVAYDSQKIFDKYREEKYSDCSCSWQEVNDHHLLEHWIVFPKDPESRLREIVVIMPNNRHAGPYISIFEKVL